MNTDIGRSSARICPPAGIFHCLRRSAVHLAVLILAAVLASCDRDPAPADDISLRQETSSCPETDRAALIALYNATGGDHWHDNTNWLSQQTVSTWFGVTTAENGCVTRLDLESNSLTGELPPELGTLPGLLYLNLRNNNLTGQFPLEWENASNMTNLYISGNNFSGCFPNQFAHLEKGTLRGLYELITDLTTGVKIDVRTAYCSDDGETSNGLYPLNSALSTPSNLSYTFQGSSIVLRWDPIAGADHYILYHDDVFDSRCRISDIGSPTFCRQLATVRGETTYTHAEPPGGRNYYWVRACNSSGCSPLITENTASPPDGAAIRPGIDYPLIPSNFTYAFEGPSVILSWDPVDGADYYNLYYHHAFPTYCYVEPDGSPSFCDLLAANLTETTYSHADPEKRTNFWVVACNSVGCSPFEGESPIKPVDGLPRTAVGDPPPVPANLTYALEGSSFVVSWDPVEGAGHYNLYYHALVGYCIGQADGSSTPCKLLAANLVETTYTHSSLDHTDEPLDTHSYYWVTACDSAGCAPFQSGSPARAVEDPPLTPADLSYARQGTFIVLTWDPVDGADYYNLYYNAGFRSPCTVHPDGSPAFCSPLATSLIETTYTHTDSADNRNFYWVAACNRGGCSPISGQSPAAPAESGSSDNDN